MRKPAADPRDIAFGLAVVCGRAGLTAGKVALVPLRVAARTPVFAAVLGGASQRLAETGRTAQTTGREQLQSVVGDVLASPEAERAVDAALASPLPEALARVVVERQVVQRIVEEALAAARVEAALEPGSGGQVIEQRSGGANLDQLVAEALESAIVSDITTRVVESAELQRVVEEVASSPAVRAALTRQTTSLAEDLAQGLRARMESLDDRAERAVNRGQPTFVAASAARARYGGLGARGVAFMIDLMISLLIFLVGAGVGALIAQLVGGFRPYWLAGLLASIGWSTVVAVYLVVFWTVTGETPGMRFMHLRVVDRRGQPPGLGHSLLRLVGLFVAIVLLFTGLIPVLFDGRRRALQDYLAGTVVRSEAERLDAA